MIGYIYIIKNKINGKIYVGQTIKDYNIRWKSHKRLLRKGKHNNNHLQNSWNKYGEYNFEFILLHEFIFKNKKERKYMLDLIEKIYITGWDLLNDKYGYNISSGGSNGNNFAGKTEEEMKVISNKMSINRIGEKNHFYGKHHTSETKEKISSANKGKYTGENNPMYGKHHSKDTKEKISNCNKGKFGKDSSHYGIGKKIAMIDKDTNEIIKVYSCIADASQEVCGRRKNSNIGQCARGENHIITVCGYKWRFVDENNNLILNEYDLNKNKKIAMIDKNTKEIILIFNSIVEANLYLNKDRKNKNIGNCLNGRNKTAFGYEWKYIFE